MNDLGITEFFLLWLVLFLAYMAGWQMGRWFERRQEDR